MAIGFGSAVAIGFGSAVAIGFGSTVAIGFGSAVAIAKNPTKAKTLKKEEKRKKYILNTPCLLTKMLCPTYSHDESRKGKGRKMHMPFYSISSKHCYINGAFNNYVDN